MPAIRLRDSPRARWGLVGALALAIAVVSVLPAGGDPTSGPLGLLGLDKWLHAVGYATLAVAIHYALDGQRQALALAVLGAVGYGLAVECLQIAAPTRSFSVGDLLANAVGAAIAAAGLALRR